jgi:hypothetical protein
MTITYWLVINNNSREAVPFNNIGVANFLASIVTSSGQQARIDVRVT